MKHLFSTEHISLVHNLYPIEAAVMIGAGPEQAHWQNFLGKQSKQRVLWVDADSRHQSWRGDIAAEHPQWETTQALISRVPGEFIFYVVANVAESSLVSPELLRPLWPNIQLKEERALDGITIDKLLEKHAISPNWGVIDCLPGVNLLEGAAATLLNFDVLVIRMALEADNDVSLEKCSQKTTLAFLAEHGFVCLGVKTERHPGLGHGLFVRNPAEATRQLRSEAVEFAKGITAIEQQIVVQKQAVMELAQLCLALETENSLPSEKQPSDFGRDVITDSDSISASQRLQNVTSILSQNTEEIKAEAGNIALFQKRGRELLVEVQEEVDKVITSRTENLKQQLESYVGIQYFLQNGAFLPQMHGWPISPDFAAFLMEMVAYNAYDIIFEFGSGTSTVLVAQTLEKVANSNNDAHRSRPIQVAFEHLEKYHEQTSVLLRQAGVADNVNLVLAPLQPWEAPSGSVYNYYSCHETLSELARQVSGKHPKIFVLVDGPPAATGRHARYPAVQSVVKEFEYAQIDILLDDYIRNDEMEIARMWMAELKAMGGDCTSQVKRMEKNACLIRYNKEHKKSDEIETE